MIVIKVKNLKTNSRLQRQLYAKCQSFIHLIGAKAYVKPTLEIYVLQSLQGQFSGFHLILFLKAVRLDKFLLTITKNVPDNWTKIGYTFGPMKCWPNKRSGKLRIKSQIVRATDFCVKILLTTGSDSPLLYTFQWRDIEYIFLSWMETEISFSKSILKDDCFSYVIRKHLSCSLFIFLFVVWLCWFQRCWFQIWHCFPKILSLNVRIWAFWAKKY